KIEHLKNTYIGKQTDVVFISATERSNIEELRNLLLKKVKERHFEIYPNYIYDPANDWQKLVDDAK
ncbi:MAG: GTPase HflX, partial [Cytophagales bacterium]